MPLNLIIKLIFALLGISAHSTVNVDIQPKK